MDNNNDVASTSNNVSSNSGQEGTAWVQPTQPQLHQQQQQQPIDVQSQPQMAKHVQMQPQITAQYPATYPMPVGVVVGEFSNAPGYPMQPAMEQNAAYPNNRISAVYPVVALPPRAPVATVVRRPTPVPIPAPIQRMRVRLLPPVLSPCTFF